MEDRKPLCCRLGNCYGVFVRPGKGPVVLIGPHCRSYLGPYAATLLCGMSLLTGVFVNQAAASSHYPAYIQAALLSCTLLVYLYTALVNPGIHNSVLAPFLSESYCRVCHCYQSSTTEHCGICEVCICDWDHHCPWVGKCIGKGNYFAFYSWLFLSLCSLLTLFLLNSKSK